MHGEIQRTLALLAAVAALVPPAAAFVQPMGFCSGRVCAGPGRRGAVGAGALSMQQQDPKRRRMLRIAELRREISQDMQRKSTELRDSYKVTRDLRGQSVQLPPPQQGDAKTAAAAAGASASASADKLGSAIAGGGATYLDKISGVVDNGASKPSGSFSKAEVTQPMTKGRRRKHLQSLFSPVKDLQADGFLVAGGFLGADGDASANNKPIPSASAGGKKMDQLLRERRTSFERRKWGTKGEEDASGSKGPRMRWGPKQLINGPSDMRLKRILRYNQQRGLLPGSEQGQASLRGVGMDLDDAQLPGGRQGSLPVSSASLAPTHDPHTHAHAQLTHIHARSHRCMCARRSARALVCHLLHAH